MIHLNDDVTILGDLLTRDTVIITADIKAPTQPVDTSTTQIATTAFVLGQAAASTDTPQMAGTTKVGTSKHYARADHVHPVDTSRAPAWSFGASPPGTAVSGDVWVYALSAFYWMFTYDSSQTTYKWMFVGGAPLFAETLGDDTTNSTTYVDGGTIGPSLTTPRAGDYEIDFGARIYCANVSTGTDVFVSPFIGTTPTDNDSIQASFNTNNTNIHQESRKLVKVSLAASTTIKLQFKVAGAGNGGHMMRRWLSLRPIRVI